MGVGLRRVGDDDYFPAEGGEGFHGPSQQCLATKLQQSLVRAQSTALSAGQKDGG